MMRFRFAVLVAVSFAVVAPARGDLSADFDHDGRVDLLVVNLGKIGTATTFNLAAANTLTNPTDGTVGATPAATARPRAGLDATPDIPRRARRGR